jgi:beta-phosphoglucomutase family hydrolase
MIKAVIFDMDGVISDTQRLHAIIESRILKKYGIDISPDEITRKYAGIPDEIFLKEVTSNVDIEIDINKTIREKWKVMIEYVETVVEPMPGAIELIKALKARGIKTAVASSSITEFIHLVLDKLSIKELFEAIVSVEEVSRGKPDPEIFLLAAKRLGLKPHECLVIEDAASGIQAAKRAGMKCIAVINDKSMMDINADMVVSSLKQISVDELLQL